MEGKIIAVTHLLGRKQGWIGFRSLPLIANQTYIEVNHPLFSIGPATSQEGTSIRGGLGPEEGNQRPGCSAFAYTVGPIEDVDSRIELGNTKTCVAKTRH
jgi:hypothetical protein